MCHTASKYELAARWFGLLPPAADKCSRSVCVCAVVEVINVLARAAAARESSSFLSRVAPGGQNWQRISHAPPPPPPPPGGQNDNENCVCGCHGAPTTLALTAKKVTRIWAKESAEKKEKYLYIDARARFYGPVRCGAVCKFTRMAHFPPFIHSFFSFVAWELNIRATIMWALFSTRRRASVLLCALAYLCTLAARAITTRRKRFYFFYFLFCFCLL